MEIAEAKQQPGHAHREERIEVESMEAKNVLVFTGANALRM